jgi:CRISPR-associated protein Csm3
MSQRIELRKKILIKGEIEALSGLLIGGSNTAMGIGGPDKMVIRNPINNEPYVPGSSIKGKIRSLLEISYGSFAENKNVREDRSRTIKFGPSDDPEHITTVLFGSASTNENQRPSRIIFRDGKLLNGSEFGDKTDLPFTESKTEVVIDRITSAAMPRTFERVPAGAKFELDIVLNIFKGDKKTEEELLSHTLRGLQMLQDDYLGGSGSRGSGRVKFKIVSITERNVEYYHNGNPEAERQRNDEIPENLK